MWRIELKSEESIILLSPTYEFSDTSKKNQKSIEEIIKKWYPLVISWDWPFEVFKFDMHKPVFPERRIAKVFCVLHSVFHLSKVYKVRNNFLHQPK